MEEKKDFLSIAEFADALGITKQAVYKRLRTAELEPYITERNGVKYISPSAMPLFAGNEPKVKEQERAEADAETIAFLKEQIAERDKKIAELQAHIIEQSKTLTAIIEKQNQIVEKQNQLQENSQILLAKIYNGKLLLSEPPKQDEPEPTVEPQVDKPLINVDKQVEQQVENTPHAVKKQGFFARILKKR